MFSKIKNLRTPLKRSKLLIALNENEEIGEIEIRGDYEKDKRRISLRADFGKVAIGPISPIFNELAPISIFSMPFSGEIALSISLDEKPDVIFAALWPLTSLVGIAHKLSGSNSILIFSDHNPLSEQYYYFNFIQKFCMRIFTNITYRLADHHVSVSNDIRNDLNKYFKLSGSKFVVINNLVTFPKSSSLDSNDFGDLDRIKNFQGYKILSVGQMKEQKNHKLLIDAFKIVTKSYKAILIIVGSGDMYKETKQYVEANNLFNQVLLPGHSSRITEYYKNADLFALSSKYEGFGNVLIEALHFGLPIVSTNCSGGPKEILCDNEFGILVKNYSPQELATGIMQMSAPSPLKIQPSLRTPVISTILFELYDQVSTLDQSNFAIGGV